MARIRSVKPEFWADEDLADLPRDARLLYIGLWNLADEHARLRGDPRYVKGQVFPYDDDLPPAGVEVLLNALVVAKKAVRYRVAGKQYIFLPNLGKHQRLEAEKVPSRLPAPEDADPDEPAPVPGLDAYASAPRADKSAPDPDRSEPHEEDHALLYGSGSMEHEVPPTAAALTRRDDEPATTQALIGEWIEHCRKRPPGPVIGQVSKQVKAMIEEGIDPADVRRGLAAWHVKGIHPSALPSVVNELMNASPTAALARASPRPSTTDLRVNQAIAAGERVQAMLEGRTA